MGLNEFKYIYLTTQFIISALKKFNWAIPVGCESFKDQTKFMRMILFDV